MKNVNKLSLGHIRPKINNAVNDLFKELTHMKKSASLKSALNQTMTTHFGSDANGAWDRRMAYDICETTFTKFIIEYGGKILDKNNTETIMSMLQKLQAVMPTETVRSENQIKLQQFSTPITVGYLVHLASGLQSGDQVIEPSAGTGMLASFAQALGHTVIVNEIDDFRFACLRTQYDDAYHMDAKYMADLLPNTRADVIVMNPPFAGDNDGTSSHTMSIHITNAVSMLKPQGRLVMVTGNNFGPAHSRYTSLFKTLDKKGSVVFTGGLPKSAFAKSGTSFDTRITVFDKGVFGAEKIIYNNPEGTFVDMAEFIRIAMPARGIAEIPKTSVKSIPTVSQDNVAEVEYTVETQADTQSQWQSDDLFDHAIHSPESPNVPKATKTPKASKTSVKGMPTMSQDNVVEVEYTNALPKFLDEAVGKYQSYEPQVLDIIGAKDHPSELVQSVAMASISPPSCSYKPKLYAHIIADGLLSKAQLETVIYAGEQHSKYIKGHRKYGEDQMMRLTDENDTEGNSYRKGYFLGDGTGCGKGRQVAGIILDNFLNGRTKAIWVSKSDKLYEDAIRDWTALGGHKNQVFSLGKIKTNDPVPHDSGILFTTYATLRGGETENRRSRLAQILEWVGNDFDGVIVFDESHALAHALSSKSERGVKKASAQGLAGLKLQNQLPEARFVYVSATGATSVANLAYADRLGLWASTEFPFANQLDFATKMTKGGVAAMEVISRDLKALGLYTARSLSYAGVEIDVLKHDLTPAQVKIYNTYADAYKQIHTHLEQALEATKISVDGETANKNAKAAAKSAFESNKQRFFNQILTAMKCPSLFQAIDNDLANDKSVVIQIVTTGGAILDRRLLQIPKSEWQDLSIDLTPREYMVDYLQNAFPTKAMKTFTDENGITKSEPLYENGNPVICQEALAMRDSMLQMVYHLPPLEGALDQIIKRYGHDNVAEVTGRGKRVIVNDAGNLCVQNRSLSSNIHETNAFMDGDKRILIFSDAGGTGRSYHADLNCKNQQQRVHYLLESGWRADNAVQGLGRTNRTNQAFYPICRPVTTDVKGERRFISTIAKRLDGLGAITKGQRDTGGQGMFSSDDNLETDYARFAMRCLLNDIYFGKASISCADFEEMTALKLTDHQGMFKTNDLPPITQVLNRILALRIDDQNMLFDIFNKYLNGVIENAKINGTYEEGVKHMQASSFTIAKSERVYEHATDQQTVCATISRKDETPFNNWEKVSCNLHAQLVRNQQSGNVAVLLPGRDITTDSGEVRQRVVLHRVAHKENMDLEEYQKSHWQQIAKHQFVPLWQQQVAQTPKYQQSEFKMITGIMLPVWDALPDQLMEIKRLITDDGQTVLGRLINDEQLNTFYGKMNINKTVAFDLTTAITTLQNSSKVTLKQGVIVKPVWVNGKQRYELIQNCLSDFNVSCLYREGFFAEIINYQQRIFIPKDQLLTGMEYLARICGVHKD